MNKVLVICLTVFIFPVFVSAYVIINEIAWMGTSVSANDEWIELHNTGTNTVDLTGWRLVAVDGQPEIIVDDVCVNAVIAAGGYFLLERTDDQTVPSISADCIYTGALGNTSEQVQLFDASGSVIDSINATDGWSAGDNATKKTMQKSGGGWITATATPKKANSSADSANPLEDTSETNSPNTDSTSPPLNSSPGGADEPYVQPENLPRIKVDAGEDQQAVVGEQVQFRPHAWGLDNVLLENARYMWNFGNGVTYEGQNVSNAYMFPGTYMVRLVVSSGKYSASDDIHVVVGSNTIHVSEAMPGESGWIEIQNTGKKSIHMGGWIIEATGGRFIVPLGTTIAPQSFVVLSAATTRVFLKREGDHAYLFYPNGIYASGVSYVFQVPMENSVSVNGITGVFTEPTPGSWNIIETEPVLSSIFPQTVIASPVIKTFAPQKNVAPVLQATPIEKDEVSEEKLEEPARDPILQSATLGDAPLLSKINREAFWFGGSLVLGGLLAVGVMLFRHRRKLL